MRRNVIGVILATILVLGALGAAGFGVYQLGYQQGLVETGAKVVVDGPGYYPGLWGFGVFGLFFRVIFLFLIFGLIARLFLGRRRWGWGPGPYRGYGDHASPMEHRLDEWHRKMHDPDRDGAMGLDRDG
ncbi:MAG: hypothetical protein WCA93_02040 [Acidimicrobiia bacterium]